MEDFSEQTSSRQLQAGVQEPSVTSTNLLYAPLQPRKLGLLVVITGGFYIPFWLYRAGKDARAIAPERELAGPIGWFFSGVFSFCLPYALPRLFDHFAAAQPLAPPPKRSLWVICGFLAFVAFAIVSLTDAFGFSAWWDLPGYIVLGFVFAQAQEEVNAVKTRLATMGETQFSYRTKANRYTLWQWLCLIVLGGLVLLAYGYLFYTDVLVSGTKLPAATFVDDSERYSFDVPQSGWTVREIGTHSDGSALLELGGPGEFQYGMVFDHGPDSSLDSVTRWRQKEALNEASRVKCDEQRSLTEDGVQVKAIIHCQGRSMGDELVTVISVYMTDRGPLEFNLSLHSAKHQVDARLPTMKAMAESFKSIEVAP